MTTYPIHPKFSLREFFHVRELKKVLIGFLYHYGITIFLFTSFFFLILYGWHFLSHYVNLVDTNHTTIIDPENRTFLQLIINGKVHYIPVKYIPIFLASNSCTKHSRHRIRRFWKKHITKHF